MLHMNTYKIKLFKDMFVIDHLINIRVILQ